MARDHKKLVIIDGNALIHRGFHALPQNLRTTDGTLVNGVYGFTTTLLNVMKELRPEYFVVTFDMGGKVFRHTLFEAYKGKRVKAPQELYDQIPIAHEVVEAMSIPIYQKKGYEADDLIGSLVTEVEVMNKKHKTKIETYIVTGDADTYQLVDANTKIYKLKRGFAESEIYDEKRLNAEFGFGPESMVEYRALKGDSSDNIPGVPGIGEKTALKIIQKFKNIDALYAALEKVPLDGELRAGDLVIKGAALKRLKENRKLAELSRELSVIIRDLNVPINLEKSTLANYDREKVVEVFHKLQFKSLLRRLPEISDHTYVIPNGDTKILEPKKRSRNKTEPSEGQGNLFDAKKVSVRDQDFTEKNKERHYETIDTEKKLKDLVRKLSRLKEFALDTETSDLGAMNSYLVGISLAEKPNEGVYIPVGHKEGTQLPAEYVIDTLRPVFENPKIGKIGHNIKYDYTVLKKAGVTLQGITFDTINAAYLFRPGERGLDMESLAFVELNYEMLPITALIGTGKKQDSFANVPIGVATFYAAEDADITFRLKKIYEKRLQKDPQIKKVFDTLEIPMIPVLGDMEFEGVHVDVAYLKKVSKQFSKKLKGLTENIYKQAGGRFNIASTRQLAEILFTKLKVPTEGIARTQTGFSTAASELTKLQGKAKIVDNILEFRELTKLKNTYLDALPNSVDPETKKIHTTYSQTIAATGRLSSVDPNLQNIPTRTDLGKLVRHAFYSKKGSSFVSLDYSQIELRIMAHISEDPTFVKAFRNNEDIHATVAAQIHEKSVAKVTADERREAKIINFAILYGAGARGLSNQTSMNYAQAKEYVEKYFDIHPKVRETIERLKKEAHKNEYAQSLYGRKRMLPDINGSYQLTRAAAERAAINMPFQGTNADIMKLAMLKLVNEMPELSSMMVLQVHDELIFEIPDEKIKKYARKIRDIMENIFPLRVPLRVNVEIGKRWSDLKEIEL